MKRYGSSKERYTIWKANANVEARKVVWMPVQRVLREQPGLSGSFGYKKKKR